MSNDRLFRLPKPDWLNKASSRQAGIYLAGGLFSIALFTIIDASAFSHSALNGSDFHVTFLDWIPFILSALGMLVVNSIDKSRLSSSDTSGFDAGSAGALSARIVLFLGFACLAGGMAGGASVLVLKYIVPVDRTSWPTLWMGVAGVVANGLVGVSSALLWGCQNMQDDYAYNLTL